MHACPHRALHRVLHHLTWTCFLPSPTFSVVNYPPPIRHQTVTSSATNWLLLSLNPSKQPPPRNSCLYRVAQKWKRISHMALISVNGSLQRTKSVSNGLKILVFQVCPLYRWFIQTHIKNLPFDLRVIGSFILHRLLHWILFFPFCFLSTPVIIVRTGTFLLQVAVS